MFGRSKSNSPAASPPPAEPIHDSPASVSATPQARFAAAASAKEAAAGPDTSGKTPDDPAARRRAAIAVRHSLAFAQIMGVLMRSAQHRRYPIAALEWLVLPPLLTGQFSIAEAKSRQNGASVPVGAVLWARVSPEVDKRLSTELDKPVQLRPREWRSGDILWLVEAVGDARVLPQLLKRLGETTFKGREVKVRSRGADGKVTVRLLAEVAAAK